MTLSRTIACKPTLIDWLAAFSGIDSHFFGHGTSSMNSMSIHTVLLQTKVISSHRLAKAASTFTGNSEWRGPKKACSAIRVHTSLYSVGWQIPFPSIYSLQIHTKCVRDRFINCNGRAVGHHRAPSLISSTCLSMDRGGHLFIHIYE